jgi:hypothetical protein
MEYSTNIPKIFHIYSERPTQVSAEIFRPEGWKQSEI